jgi:hypothetical protein
MRRLFSRNFGVGLSPSTQQKRGWHREFDLSGITIGLPHLGKVMVSVDVAVGSKADIPLLFRKVRLSLNTGH